MFLNPDAAPRPGFGDGDRAAAGEGRGWAAWQALVTAEAGRRDQHARRRRPLHRHRLGRGRGEPVAASAAAGEVGFVSGACLAIPRDAWRELGGFAERLLPLPRGRRPLAAAAAARRAARRRARARRRPRLRVRQGRRQVAAAGAQPLGDARPHLPGGAARAARAGAAGTELALLVAVVAAAGCGQKLGAWAGRCASLPRLLRERREVQAAPRDRRRRVRARG